ncbi:hypothetical protein JG688_00015938 [Phytophthora aleatoria]|uniref:Kinesin motor domain-containing protein n=1 Tax=Phytophthora aleatoria TaxID=2496075 RepID=A0A8J5LZ99_9STRA|nr:hypothetical protein JG688_00015938 [Phytophthora aleatoria]
MFVLVDLAGAEYTGEGLVRNSKEQKEAREINSSLIALKECIRVQARQGTGHIPYRNSKLTMLLKCYLETDNPSCTIMITNVSSAETHWHRIPTMTCNYITKTLKKNRSHNFGATMRVTRERFSKICYLENA